jgi:hypothetical protein
MSPKTLLPALALLLLASRHPASAKSLTSTDFVTLCSAYTGPDSALNNSSASYCAGYIAGVTETLSIIKSTQTAFCLPDAVNKNQIVFVVKSYMDNNPNNLSGPVPEIIYNALAQGFPCASGN